MRRNVSPADQGFSPTSAPLESYTAGSKTPVPEREERIQAE